MKQTISKVKRQPSEWEKIKATDKELISKMTHTFKKLFHFTISHSHRRDFFGGQLSGKLPCFFPAKRKLQPVVPLGSPQLSDKLWTLSKSEEHAGELQLAAKQQQKHSCIQEEKSFPMCVSLSLLFFFFLPFSSFFLLPSPLSSLFLSDL